MKKRINYEAKSPNSSRDYFGLDEMNIFLKSENSS